MRDDGSENMNGNNKENDTNKKPQAKNDEMSCDLDLAILLFYEILQSLNAEDKLKFIVSVRLMSHMTVVFEELAPTPRGI